MKAYMLFLEGGEIPKVIHRTEEEATLQAGRLAESFPDKEVMLMRVTKRFKFTEGNLESLGSHFPPTRQLTTKNLVKGTSFINSPAHKLPTLKLRK